MRNDRYDPGSQLSLVFDVAGDDVADALVGLVGQLRLLTSVPVMLGAKLR